VPGATEQTLPEAGRRLRLNVWMISLAAIVLSTDQATKYWAISALAGDRQITVIPHLIQLRLLYNPGAAFSIGAEMTWVFTLAAAIAVVGILYTGRRLGSPGWAVALGGLLGGAASHLLDRLLRAPGLGLGHVVDFIDYNGFFVGNIADIAITGGTGLLVLLSVRGVPIRPAPPADEPRGTA
jgi:signal peptidase II